MAKELAKHRYSPRTDLARKIFGEIKKLPERDGVDGPSNEYYLRKIMEYLDYLDKNGKPPTVAGLAFFIGIHHTTLKKYARNEELALSLGRFMQIIHMNVEEELTEGNGGAPLIFMAKNLDYTDKQVVEHEHTFSQLSQEEIDARIKRLEMIESEQATPGLNRLAEQAGGSRTEFKADTEIEAVYEVIEDE